MVVDIKQFSPFKKEQEGKGGEAQKKKKKKIPLKMDWD